MMFLKRVFPIFSVLITLNTLVFAQGKPIGYWTSYLPYNSAIGLATDGGTLFVDCGQGFFTFNGLSTEWELATYSKVEGMSDIGMKCVGYDAATATAVLVYANGNIDLFKDNTFYNIPDLKIKSIAGAKDVYEVYTETGKAYLSSAQGVIVIDLEKHTILATYQFFRSSPSGIETLPVRSFKSSGGYFYAATDGGLYRANRNNPQLQNYQVWSQLDTIRKVVYMACIEDTIFFANNKTIYRLNADTFKSVYSDTSVIRHLDGGHNQLFVSESNPSMVRMLNMSNQLVDSFAVNGLPMQVVQLSDESVWIADSLAGLRRRQPNGLGDYVPAGPGDASTYDVIANNGEIWIAHGGYTDNFSAMFKHSGISRYKSNKWTSFREFVYRPFDGLTDFVTLVKDEKTGTVYCGSFMNGMYAMKSDETGELIGANSVFDSSIAYFGSGQRQVVGLAKDKSDNIWISLMYAYHQLYVRTPEGTMYEFRAPNTEYGGPLVVDDYGQAWYVSSVAGGVGGGVVVYNTNNTFDDLTDDASYHLVSGAGYGNLPSNTVYSIAKDQNNAIWVGTSDGIGIINGCYAPFNQTPPCDAEKPIVQYDQFAGYLFAGNNVRTIAVDGANRKWVGTDDGVWLLSADANKIIYRFTEENSPLPSNAIRKISIDQVTGDVYIGTDKGLIAYRSTATEGGTANENVIAFPNPVPADYSGTIAIKGLVENADIRITDITGQLVYRTKAFGGQAVWNGLDYKGRKPQSGVYLVFASNSDGSQTYSGKLVFMK